MAQGNPRLGLNPEESISDVVHDLDLLFPDGYGKVTITDAGELREKKKKELMETNGTLQEGYERILNALEQTRDRQHILKHYYEKVDNVLQETAAINQKEKEEFLSEAEKCIKDLKNKRYTVLITGETSAGKSSLVNLLLNDTVLPTSIKQNTHTICEISYGPRKEAVLHFSKQTNPSLELKESEFHEIKKYIEKPLEDEHWCERIEIKIPNRLLEGGVVIVDSPGVCDSEHVSKIALKYLPQAYAFVYVINSTNAGGLQEDRLMRILREWVKLYEGDKQCGITGKSALFVCNKWDEVEKQTNQTDKEALQKHIIEKLTEKIPELDEKTQVIQMSVMRANKVQKRFDVMNDDLNGLINGLQHLLPLCIEIKTEYFYCWISGELCNLSDQVRGEMRNAKRSRAERLEARQNVEGKLEKLKQGTPIKDFEDAISNHVKQLSQKMESYLQSDEVRRRFCTWSIEDLSRIKDYHEESSMKIQEAISRCILERFRSFLQNWENKEKFFTKAHADLKIRFHQCFYDFENDLRDIDCVLVGESRDEFLPIELFRRWRFSPPSYPNMTKYLVMTLGTLTTLFAPRWAVPILFSSVGYLWVSQLLHHMEWLISDELMYNSIRLTRVLSELSEKFLKNFNERKVHNYVCQRFSAETNRIVTIKRCHKELITKYEQRCKDLTRSEDEAKDKETLEKYGPFHAKLQKMNQELMFDAIQNGIQVMSCQIDFRRLRYNETERDKLGGGSYGTVFKGTFTPPGHGRKDVAVKKLREAPQPSTVATFLREADMLKQLEHENIIFFYGVAMHVQNHKLLSLELVFDLCPGSLKNHIFQNVNCMPWKTASAMADTLQWIKQILDALEFMHSKNVIHRDLKLDNILITRSGHIKVADLGLANLKNRITGTVCGTYLYMAPEVYEGKPYDAKVDMYSFGLIMWEMWFGKQAFSELICLNLSREEFRQRIKDENYRPQTPRSDGRFTPIPPPAQWTELMESCWQTEPSLRRTAIECKDLIKGITNQYVQ